MSLQQPARSGITGVVTTLPPALLTDRYRAAQSKLNLALQKEQTVALVVGADSFELSHIVDTFLANLGKRLTFVRLKHAQVDALEALREINRSLGFDPKDLSLSDLQGVLTMFLDYQSKHNHRTVLCIEKADEQCKWLLDCIAELVTTTKTSRPDFNLMVVLSGGNGLSDLLQNSAFDVLRVNAGRPVMVPPFSIDETREFVRQISSAAGIGEIQTLFDFDAVDRLYRISGGVPYRVARLCRECLAIVDRSGNGPATGRTVVRAARNLRSESGIDMEMAVVKGASRTEQAVRRLIVRCAGLPLRHILVHPGRYMVGRSKTADIQVPSPSVSRRHALIINTEERLQLLDLGSVNGTYVGEQRISELAIDPGTVLKLGDCEIEYTSD